MEGGTLHTLATRYPLACALAADSNCRTGLVLRLWVADQPLSHPAGSRPPDLHLGSDAEGWR